MFLKRFTAGTALLAISFTTILFPLSTKADEAVFPATEAEAALTEEGTVVFKDFPVAGVAACVADGEDYAGVLTDLPAETEEITEEQVVADVFKPDAVCAVGDYIYIRSLPQDSACDPVGIFYHNAVAEILDVEGEWTKIRSGNVTGYILTEFLTTGEEALPIIEAAKVVTGTVNTDNLAMRMGPDENSELVEILPIGEEVVVYATIGDWTKVRSEEGEGYVFSSYLNTKASYITALTNEEVSAQEKMALRKEMEEKARRGIAYNALNGQPSHFISRQDGNIRGQEVAEFALQFVGNPYVWGGSSLTEGADCSGFVMAVYKEFGFELTHSTEIDQTEGVGIPSIEEAEAGDIICYQGHVGIYIGDGMVVHAAGTGKGIRVDMACFDNIITVRRMFTD